MRLLPLLLLTCAGLLGASWLSGSLSASTLTPAAFSQAQEPAADDAEAEIEELRDPAEIREELQAAQRDREATLADHALQIFEHEVRMMEARFALENARADLNAFETYQQRADVEEAEFMLTSMRDGAQDAEEELQQLEQMYGENELANRTAEIVLSRGRRELERTREELRQAEESHRHQLQVAIPRAQIGLRQAVQSAEMDLRLADLEQESMRIGQQNASAEQEVMIRDLKQELAEAEAAAVQK